MTTWWDREWVTFQKILNPLSGGWRETLVCWQNAVVYRVRGRWTNKEGLRGTPLATIFTNSFSLSSSILHTFPLLLSLPRLLFFVLLVALFPGEVMAAAPWTGLPHGSLLPSPFSPRDSTSVILLKLSSGRRLSLTCFSSFLVDGTLTSQKYLHWRLHTGVSQQLDVLPDLHLRLPDISISSTSVVPSGSTSIHEVWGSNSGFLSVCCAMWGPFNNCLFLIAASRIISGVGASSLSVPQHHYLTGQCLQYRCGRWAGWVCCKLPLSSWSLRNSVSVGTFFILNSSCQLGANFALLSHFLW